MTLNVFILSGLQQKKWFDETLNVFILMDLQQKMWFDETLNVFILFDLEQKRWFVETRNASSPKKYTKSIPKIWYRAAFERRWAH